jgi:hypothetical protein
MGTVDDQYMRVALAVAISALVIAVLAYLCGGF